MAEQSQTLTMDETTPESGQFTEEEMDSLKVGEEMQEAQDTRLAGKYENAKELEKAYIELEKKIGEPSSKETDEEKPAAEDTKESKEESDKSTVLDKLWGERQDGFSEDTLKELSQTDAGELAKEYLQYRQDQAKVQPKGLTEDDVTRLKDVVGGEQTYNQMVDWAGQNLSNDEQKMYDTIVDRGDPLACYFAILALQARYQNETGSDGKLIQGKAPSSSGAQYRSQAELVAAMADPKYDQDPAYRRDVQEKLERSKLNF